MRRLLSGICVAALALGCGFDTVPPNAQPTGGSGGATTTGGVPATSGGSSAMNGGVPATSGGTSPMAGQPAGTAGSSITPTGGSANPGGASNGGGGSGGTSAGNGGQSTAGGGAGGGAPVDPHFTLAWRDDFDTFDTTRWTKQTHTFPENLARFSAANAVVEGGLLKLRVTHVQNGDKAYTAAELASKDLFTFGRFAGRIKFCAGSGMVSSMFTYHDDVNTSWQEIDLEHLGSLPKSVQYNLISGDLNNRVYQPKVVTFQFGPPLDFHDYVLEWTPSGVTAFVDGNQTYHDVQASLKDAARLHMNAWPTDNSVTTFAGAFNADAVPCEAQYDWIEAYTYTP